MASFGNGIGLTTSLVALIANAGAEDQAIATAGKQSLYPHQYDALLKFI